MQEVLNTLFGTFLGALLGIPCGLALNHVWSVRVNTARTRQLRSALLNSITKNEGLLAEIDKWVGRIGIPFFNVDLTLLDSTANLKYEVFDDIDLCRRIDHLRFELTHLSRKIEMLVRLETDPMSRTIRFGDAGTMYDILRTNVATSIQDHIKAIRENIADLQPRLQ